MEMTIKEMAKLLKGDEKEAVYEGILSSIDDDDDLEGVDANALADMVLKLSEIKGLNQDFALVVESLWALLLSVESLDTEEVKDVKPGEVVNLFLEKIDFDELKIDKDGLFKNNSKNRRLLSTLREDILSELSKESADTKETTKGKFKINLSESDRPKVKSSKDDDKPLMEDVSKTLHGLVDDIQTVGNGNNGKPFEMLDGSLWEPKTGKSEWRFNSNESLFEEGFTEKSLIELVGFRPLDKVIEFYTSVKASTPEYDYDYLLWGMRRLIEKEDKVKKIDQVFQKEKNYLSIDKQFLNMLKHCMVYKLETEEQRNTFKEKYKEAKARQTTVEFQAKFFRVS